MAVNKQKGKRKGVRQQEHWAQYLVLIALMFAIAPTAVFFYRTLKPSAVVRASKSVQNQIRNMSSEATSTANGTSITFKKPRPVLRKLPSREQGEGEGVRVWRSIGRPEMRNLDPFLMLDEARVKPPAGFPDHPHRGNLLFFLAQGVPCNLSFYQLLHGLNYRYRKSIIAATLVYCSNQ
eukprot:jgi/Mesen1/969/ME000012S00533